MAANHNHQHQFGTGCGHSHGPAAVDDHHRGDGEFDDFNDLLQESHPCCAKDAASKARCVLSYLYLRVYTCVSYTVTVFGFIKATAR